eukprot:1161942-Pelagomonas_calceolata.AAC.18
MNNTGLALWLRALGAHVLGSSTVHEESSGDEEHGHRHSQSVPSMGTPNDPAVHSVLSTQVGKVAAIEQHHAACSNLSLARYLLDWWIERMGKYVPSAPAGSFAWKLVEWFEQEGWVAYRVMHLMQGLSKT